MLNGGDTKNCILCGREMDFISQEQHIPEGKDSTYKKYGNSHNQFCDECIQRDYMMRVQALIRMNKLNSVKNIYKSQAVKYEKTAHKKFEDWVLKTITTTSNEYLGNAYVVRKLQDVKKEVEYEINYKIRKRDRYQELIDKNKIIMKQLDKDEQIKTKKEIKKYQNKINTELKKIDGKFIFPKEVEINING
jgi:ATP-dependent Lon protease